MPPVGFELPDIGFARLSGGEVALSGAIERDSVLVLVSGDGRIASGVVGGGPAVLELLRAGELAASR